MTRVTVLHTGFLSTIQDTGRWGYQRFGMPVSGPMDWYAYRSANFLLGNEEGAAGIEIGATGIQLRVDGDCLAVLCGYGYDLWVNRRRIPLWMTFLARSGQVINVSAIGVGGWAYLNFFGGVKTPLVMKSRSTYLRGAIGGYQGRTLLEGDQLDLNSLPPTLYTEAGKKLCVEAIPAYGSECPIEVIEGIHQDRFSLATKELFYSQSYTIRSDSDRMGYRLEGEPIHQDGKADVLSNGMALGTIQVPGNGKPIVMMADHPTTGGYTQIAVVIKADMPLFAQRMHGTGEVTFRKVSLEHAQEKYKRLLKQLANGIEEDEDENYRSEF